MIVREWADTDETPGDTAATVTHRGQTTLLLRPGLLQPDEVALLDGLLRDCEMLPVE